MLKLGLTFMLVWVKHVESFVEVWQLTHLNFEMLFGDREETEKMLSEEKENMHSGEKGNMHSGEKSPGQDWISSL